MSFDFLKIIEELKENPEKASIVEKYEKHYGTIENDIKQQVRYKEYVVNFPTVPYRVPEEVDDLFDWGVLMQLVAGSLASQGYLHYGDDESLPEFLISVQAGSTSSTITKKVSELWPFQIDALFSIYIHEQMSMQVMIAESGEEKDVVLLQRDSRQKSWGLMLEGGVRKKEEQQEQVHKKEKLDDLYGQL